MRSPGLRGRFILANLVVISVLTAVLIVVSAQLFESYEAHAMKGQVAVDLQRLAAMQPHTISSFAFGNSRGLVVRAGDLSPLPPSLRDMPPGIHEDIVIDGQEYFAGRDDRDGLRLYVLLDAQPFEEMEARLLRYVLWSLLAGALVAVLVSLWMSRQVLKPVTELSAWAASIRPGQPQASFDRRYGDADIDRMASAFEAYRVRLEEFVAREQALTEDVSHELRTPIAVARSTLTLLREDADLSPLARQRIGRLERAVRQMEELVEAILFLAREDGGGSCGPVALDELVLEAVDSRQEAAARAGVVLRVASLLPQTIVAHRGMVMSVIGNVLDNAIRHGGAGDVILRLDAGQLVVADHGPGIAPERLDAVFSRKARGEGSRGHGLGLHIVRGLCARLGWTITLAGDEGTRVTLAFPSGI